MDIDDGITLRAADDPTIKNELRRAWIADRLDERLGEFGQTHAVDVVCATWLLAEALRPHLNEPDLFSGPGGDEDAAVTAVRVAVDAGVL